MYFTCLYILNYLIFYWYAIKEDCQLALYYRTYLKRIGDGIDGNHMLSSIVL